MRWNNFLFRIWFFLRTWHSPWTYRQLFRDISSCYLTPQKPGKARVAGHLTECITSTPLMVITLDGGSIYYVQRDELIVRKSTSDENIELWDKRIKPLKKVFDEMLDIGIPYSMSDVGVTEMGI